MRQISAKKGGDWIRKCERLCGVPSSDWPVLWGSSVFWLVAELKRCKESESMMLWINSLLQGFEDVVVVVMKENGTQGRILIHFSFIWQIQLQITQDFIWKHNNNNKWSIIIYSSPNSNWAISALYYTIIMDYFKSFVLVIALWW